MSAADLGSKKGTVADIVLMPTFVTAVVLGVIFLRLFAAIAGIGADMQFEKMSMAVNSALLISVLHDVHSNAQYIYYNNYDFKFDFQANKVIVYQKAKDESGAGFFYFSEDGPKGRLRFIPNALNVAGVPIFQLYFVKQGNDVFVDSPAANKKFRANLNLLECSRESAEKLGKGIIIDPGYGWDEKLAKEGALDSGSKGDVHNDFVESEITWVLAAKLLGYGKDVFADKSFHTRSLSQDSKASVDERIAKIDAAGNTVISIHVGSYDDGSFNPVIAYINGDSEHIAASRQLACLILNSLSNKFPEITDLAVIPVSVEQLDEFDRNNPLRVLRKDKIGIQLVLGNIQSENKNIFSKGLDDIARAVYDGVDAYE